MHQKHEFPAYDFGLYSIYFYKTSAGAAKHERQHIISNKCTQTNTSTSGGVRRKNSRLRSRNGRLAGWSCFTTWCTSSSFPALRVTWRSIPTDMFSACIDRLGRPDRGHHAFIPGHFADPFAAFHFWCIAADCRADHEDLVCAGVEADCGPERIGDSPNPGMYSFETAIQELEIMCSVWFAIRELVGRQMDDTWFRKRTSSVHVRGTRPKADNAPICQKKPSNINFLPIFRYPSSFHR